MPNLQELDNDQINEAIHGAADKRIPIVVTSRLDDGWVIFYSRLVAMEGTHLFLEPPRSDADEQHDFTPADRVGLSFKYRHHKHICSATVAGWTTHAEQDGGESPVLCVICPTRMHRLQRRVYQRVSVPEGKIARASFWLGGGETEPAGTSTDIAVWPGTIDNISAGGFQMSCPGYAGPSLQVGDAIGVHLSFGIGRERCFTDAQFRHLEVIDGVAHLGFQFVGLAQSRQGRAALQMISAKVSEFQRMQEGPKRRRFAS